MKDLYKIIESIIMDFYYRALWNFRKDHGLNTERRNCNIVVSLTSFPGRIHIVHKTIRTLLMQKTKPDKIELWLAVEQFPQKVIPEKLKKLDKFGLTICWTTDSRSYKKLIPTLTNNQNSIIITCDDDVYYKRTWLQRLYASYLKYPTDIHCHRATQMIHSNEGWSAIGGGQSYYHEASFLNKLVGIGGVLYPPKSLHEDVSKKELFMKLAPTNDDIWFWLMAVLNNCKVRVCEHNQHRPVDVLGAAKTAKLNTINDHGDMLFWKQFYNILRYYPSLEHTLKQSIK